MRLFETVLYPQIKQGSTASTKMQRLTARLLLLFALAGTFAPLALAATAPSPHACCVRHAHNCHSSADAEPQQLTLRATNCCTHDCCRAATISQWANPQPRQSPVFAQNISVRAPAAQPQPPAQHISQSQSTRAPPQIS